MFDTSLGMVDAIQQGVGIGLVPPLMFERNLTSGAIVKPFDLDLSLGGYWLTWLHSRSVTPAMTAFMNWLFAKASDAAME